MEAVALTLPHLPAQESSNCDIGNSDWLRLPAEEAAALRERASVRPLELWHLASLDAPTVAAAWSLGFAWAAGVRLAAWAPLLLALTVWAVYIFDRLLDARAALRATEINRLRERHFFHWRHRHVLLPLAVAAAGVAAGLVLAFMPMAARERDALLAVPSVAYFARVHAGHRSRPFFSSLLTKELLVGLLFTVGCALPAWGALLAARGALWPLASVTALFAPLAWLNCHAIDRWEAEPTDAWKPQAQSRKPSSSLAAGLLAAAGFLLAALIAGIYPRAAALVAIGAVSALLLALLDRWRGKLNPVALRAAADLALLTPALLLALAWLAR